MVYAFTMPKGDKKDVLKKIHKNLNDFVLYRPCYAISTKKESGRIASDFYHKWQIDDINPDSCRMLSFYGQMHGRLVIISLVYDESKVVISSKIPIDQVMCLSEQLGLVPCEDYGFCFDKASLHAV